MNRRMTYVLGVACLAAIAGCAEEANYITEFEDIGPGELCPAGGVRLLAGFDEDDDDKLAAGEVDRMDNICNGSSPPGPINGDLLRVEELPVGGRCINGGAVVFQGTDMNADGVLQDGEIEDATFICNGTDFEGAFEACEGDAGPTLAVGTIVVETEAQLAALTGVRCVRGNLVIDRYPGDDLEPLASLVAVTGDFLVINSSSLADVVGLRSLRVVGGNFLLQNLPGVATIAGFDQMEDVHGRFSIAGTGITDLEGLETLATFSGELQIMANEDLVSLHGLENLREIGDFVVDNNDALTDITAVDGMEHVTGRMIWIRNDAITEVSSESLGRVDGTFDVMESPGVINVRLPNLLLPGAVRFRDNENLVTVEMPRTVVVGGIVEFMRNESLTTVRFPALGYTSGSFYFLTNPALVEVTAPQLTTIGAQLYFRENSALESFTGLSSVRSLGTDLVILDNDRIARMEGLSGLEVINGSFLVELNTTLNSFEGLTNLRIVRNRFEVEDNPNLCEPAISELMGRITIGGDITIDGNCTGGGPGA